MTQIRSPFVKLYLEDTVNGNFDLTGYVHSFDSEEDSEKDDMITIRIKDELSFILLNKRELTMKAVLVYQFGFMAAAMSDIRKAIIDDIDPDYGEGDNVSLIIRATDKGVVTKNSGTTKVWRNVTASDIALAIANKYGLEYRIDKTTKVYESLPQGNRPDFAFLKYLAAMEGDGDYMSYFTGEILYFLVRRLATTSVATFVRGEYEVFKFRPRWTEKGKDKAVSAVSALSIDAETGTMIQAVSENKDTDPNVGGSSEMALFLSDGQSEYEEKNTLPYIAKVDNTKDTTDLPFKLRAMFAGILNGQIPADTIGKFICTPEYDKATMQAMVNKANKEAKLQILQAELDVLGNPLITLNDIVTVSKVANKHEGNWYVWGVKNSIEGSSYITTLKLARNALEEKHLANVFPKGTGTQNKTVGVDSLQPKREIPRVGYNKVGNEI